MTEAAPEVTPEAPEVSAREAATNIPANDFAIPDAYKEAKWVNEVGSTDDLWKRVSDLQALAGKKSIPTADSSDEELNSFYDQVRPKESSEYEFTVGEGQEVDEAFQGKVKDILHKHGLSSKQASGVHDDYMAAVGEMMAAEQSEESVAAREAEIDADFDKLSTEMFGDKSGEAIKVAHKYLASVDPSVKESFSKLPNDQLLAVTKIINDIHGKYAGEDSMPTSGGGSGTTQSIDDVRKELAELRTSSAAKDFTHKDHKEASERVKVLSSIVQKTVK